MEYKIDNKSKYTTLQIRTMLDCKKKERKAKKRHGRKSPQGGWGAGSKEPTQKIFSLLLLITILEN